MNIIHRCLKFPINYIKRKRQYYKIKSVEQILNESVNLSKVSSVAFDSKRAWIKIRDGREFHWDLIRPNTLLTIPDTGTFEEKDSEFLRKTIKPGMVTFDCGANFGWYSTLLAAVVTGTGEVHSFEPVPAVCESLKLNVQRNSLTSIIRVNNFALGDKPGKLSMMIPLRQGTGTPFASFKKQTWGRHESISVDVMTLTDYVAEKGIKSIDFIKCDVEGAEFLILKGAEPLFERGMRPLIMLEIVESSMEPFGFSRSDIYATLEKYGYRPFTVRAAGTLEAVDVKKRPSSDNIFFIPKDSDLL